MKPNELAVSLGRRTFVRNGVLVLTVAGMDASAVSAEQEPVLKVGLVTDLHYADKSARGSRHYRETLDKLAEAGEQFRQQKPAFLVELGDFIDAADSVDDASRGVFCVGSGQWVG